VTTPSGPVLYTALTDLRVDNGYATWIAPAGSVLPLLPAAYPTLLLIENGSIEPAPPNAVDTATPARMLKGQPGVHIGVSN
jgi:hypothetical protein